MSNIFTCRKLLRMLVVLLL